MGREKGGECGMRNSRGAAAGRDGWGGERGRRGKVGGGDVSESGIGRLPEIRQGRLRVSVDAAQDVTAAPELPA